MYTAYILAQHEPDEDTPPTDNDDDRFGGW